MGGDYSSSDFEIEEDGALRRVVHLPTGMTIESNQLSTNPTRSCLCQRIQTVASGGLDTQVASPATNEDP